METISKVSGALDRESDIVDLHGKRNRQDSRVEVSVENQPCDTRGIGRVRYTREFFLKQHEQYNDEKVPFDLHARKVMSREL